MVDHRMSLRERQMRCPFLEEVLVRYCKAYPIKKLIPSCVSDKASLCLSDDYVKCAEYRDAGGIDGEISRSTCKTKHDEWNARK